MAWGQRQPKGSGRLIQLGDGQTREVSIDLPRAGVITGTVVNARGEPVIGTQVQGFQIAVMNGQRTPRAAGGASTDDRGMYRIHSLQPGEYIVCASHMNHEPMTDRHRLQRDLENLRRARIGPMPNPEAAQAQLNARIAQLEAQLAVAGAEPARGYAPACVPGALPGMQGTIPIAPGEERSSIDLHLERTQLTWIEGTLMLPPGVTPRDVFITLFRPGDVLSHMGNTHVMLEESGRFMRDNLVPGEYRIEARTRVPNPSMGGGWISVQGPRRPDPDEAPVSIPRVWASADVLADSGGVTGLTLEFQPAVSISGELVFDGTAALPPDLSRLRVVANPAMPPVFRPVMADTAQGSPDDAGRFTIPGVFPGTYRLGTGFQGWNLRSVTLGGQDLLDFPLEVRPGQPVTGVVVTLTDRQTEISGTLVDSRGEPASDHSLVLFSADDRYWTQPSRRVRLARAGADGSFAFRGMPAGDYRLAAIVDFDTAEWNSREFLQALAWTSTRIAVNEGDKKSVALRVRAGD